MPTTETRQLWPESTLTSRGNNFEKFPICNPDFFLKIEANRKFSKWRSFRRQWKTHVRLFWNFPRGKLKLSKNLKRFLIFSSRNPSREKDFAS
jgi:hypothetical protein